MLDWPEKREITRIILGLHSGIDIFNEYISNAKDAAHMADLASDNASWSKPNTMPQKKYRKYFSTFSKKLELIEQVPGAGFLQQPLEQFVKKLPEKHKERVRNALDLSEVNSKYLNRIRPLFVASEANCTTGTITPPRMLPASNVAGGSPSTHFALWIPDDAPTRTVLKGLEDRHLDQSFYYQTAESVAKWFQITNASDYSMSDACSQSLIWLTDSTEWSDFIANDQFLGSVMLGGGGSPTKDLRIMRSMANHPRFHQNEERRPRHTLIDASKDMLMASRVTLRNKYLSHTSDVGKKIFEAVQFDTIFGDIMNLRAEHSEFHRGIGNVAWFLTGGTLGNLNEVTFLDSLGTSARRGDMLILGVGICKKEPTEAEFRKFELEYATEELRSLVAVPLRALWAELNLPGQAKDAIDSMQLKAAINSSEADVCVSDTVTIISKIILPHYGEITLFKSSRYNTDSLITFVEGRRWGYVTSFSNSKNDFRQLVFKYIG